ncbi:NmrA family transcriptional regulator [Mycolicibacterium madagascariense]|uniref:NmrA family transcriptional regulator n=1 Tax=Mycolicibacterium madagascariense TaxID=212765 RepID=A0A7I7XEI3_9MYCO|nr:NAD(P)H-binding protein [Mycolicibacterium madagascariense]MCV7015228.1 NAD(P)H-binding protein [Mycolicibacterium madagascariense]BBZ27521.1 NmrA family transcriptional regulator [Mycolicibacterium madagascariense]
MGTVAIFGATGRTGVLLLDRALTCGHHVVAVARRPESLADSMARWAHTDRLRIVAADVRDPAAVEAAVEGTQAAISAIASTGRHPDRVFSEGTRNIVNALQRQQVWRFICISSRGVNYHDPALPLPYRAVIRPLFLGEVYADMQQMESIVRGSDLRWTLIRAPRLRDGPARGGYRIEDGHNPRRGWSISRADLAAFTVDQVDSVDWIHRAPTLAY